MSLGKRNPVVWGHLRAKRRFRQSDINMTPIMNLFILLIPFLLMSATFIELAIVHSALTELESGAGGDELQVSPIVDIDSKGFVLRSRSVNLSSLFDKKVVKAGKGTLRIDGYDVAKLREKLQLIKSLSPDERSLSIAPAADTPYQIIIKTMDGVRTYKHEGVSKPLFTNVAFMKRYGKRG